MGVAEYPLSLLRVSFRHIPPQKRNVESVGCEYGGDADEREYQCQYAVVMLRKVRRVNRQQDK